MRSVTTRPDEAYFERGLVNAYTEAYDQAAVDFTQAITLEYEPLSWAYTNRGVAYKDLGNETQATSDFKKALELTDDADFRQRLEYTLQELEAMNP